MGPCLLSSPRSIPMADVMEIWHLQDPKKECLILRNLAIMEHTMHFEPKAELMINNYNVTCHNHNIKTCSAMTGTMWFILAMLLYTRGTWRMFISCCIVLVKYGIVPSPGTPVAK